MAAGDRTALRSDIRTELADGATVWSDTELNRFIEKVVADVSRLMPQEKMYEATFTKDIEDETFTSSYGTAVTLNNRPIQVNSETVTTTDGTTTYTRDDDYTMDYANGTITVLSSGDMADATSYEIDYTIHRSTIDLSGITGMITPVRVEFLGESGTGEVPQMFDNFFWWDEVLFLNTMRGRTQSKMSDDDHVRVYYYAEHTAPTDAAAGTYPRYMDEIVVKGAVAYALFEKAREMNLQAGETDLASARTAAGNMSTPLNNLTGAGNPQNDADTAIDNAVGELSALETAISNATAAASAGDVLFDLKTALTNAADIISHASNPDMEAAVVNIAAQAALAVADTNAGDAMKDIKAALDKVDTYAVSGVAAGTTDSAVEALEERTTQSLLTNAKTALDLVNAIVDKAYEASGDTGELKSAQGVWTDEVKHILTTAGIPNAEDLLELGDDLINAVNVGNNAAELYRAYALAALDQAQLWADKRKDFLASAREFINTAMGHIQEANARAAQWDRILAESREWIRIAESFVAEGNARFNVSQAHLGAARAYADEAQFRAQQAQLYLNEARERAGIAEIYFTEAEQRSNKAQIYFTEAQWQFERGNLYIREAQGWAQQATSYFELAGTLTETADRILADARERFQDYWAHLSSKTELARRRTLVSTQQYGSTTRKTYPTGSE